LAAFRFQKELKAQPGNPGGKVKMHGRSAKHLMVAVPVGTLAMNESGETVADLVYDGQQAIVARGGKGGFGNAHFVSSRRQAPKFAEKGEPGEKFDLSLELKLIADVGLVGMPNAGKSTLLSKVSNARPEIADYPFTTVTPNLGVVDVDNETSLLLADIPGLIEGAAGGKGLGHDFLRHIERTAVILHLIDAYQPNIADAYQTIRTELAAYDQALADRQEIVAITKVEGLDEEITQDLITQLQHVCKKGTPILAISSQSGFGLKPLLYQLKDTVLAARAALPVKDETDTLPVLRLTDTSDEWQVEKVDNGFKITGQKITHFARRTNFENEESLQRLRVIMKKLGITHELMRQGVEPNDLVWFENQNMTFIERPESE
jgi:GTP-binding protein